MLLEGTSQAKYKSPSISSSWHPLPLKHVTKKTNRFFFGGGGSKNRWTPKEMKKQVMTQTNETHRGLHSDHNICGKPVLEAQLVRFGLLCQVYDRLAEKGLEYGGQINAPQTTAIAQWREKKWIMIKHPIKLHNTVLSRQIHQGHTSTWILFLVKSSKSKAHQNERITSDLRLFNRCLRITSQHQLIIHGAAMCMPLFTPFLFGGGCAVDSTLVHQSSKTYASMNPSIPQICCPSSIYWSCTPTNQWISF